MRTAILSACLLLILYSSNAQVYQFKPMYYCERFYIHEYHSLQFDSIQPFTGRPFVIDLNNKTISSPAEMEIIPISEVISQAADQLILKTKKEKGSIVSWHQYVVSLHNDSVICFEEQEMFKGEGKKDTTFNTYTNDGSKLCFSGIYTMKFDLSEPDTQGQEVFNIVSMRDGYITWQEGKKKDAVIHHLQITRIARQNSDKNKGLNIYCTENGIEYKIFYGRSYLINFSTHKEEWYSAVIFISWGEEKDKKRIILKYF